MIATKRIYLTADRKSAVEEGNDRAAFLLVGVGGEISDEQAAALGLLGSKSATIEEAAKEPEPAQVPVNRTVSTKSIKKR